MPFFFIIVHLSQFHFYLPRNPVPGIFGESTTAVSVNAIENVKVGMSLWLVLINDPYRIGEYPSRTGPPGSPFRSACVLAGNGYSPGTHCYSWDLPIRYSAMTCPQPGVLIRARFPGEERIEWGQGRYPVPFPKSRTVLHSSAGPIRRRGQQRARGGETDRCRFSSACGIARACPGPGTSCRSI